VKAFWISVDICQRY